MARFFIIIQPGLEEILALEFQDKYPTLKYEIHKGGLEVECDEDFGYSFNRYLKSATRVLLRLKEFRCRDLPKLYQQVTKLEWNDYLVNGDFSLEVSCSQSRLNNEKRVAKAVEDGLKTYLRGKQPKRLNFTYNHHIWIRVHNDICQISIDTSGEALYRRGAGKLVGEASLRENIAYALLYPLVRGVGAGGSVGAGGCVGAGVESNGGGFDFIDPMCGSGTFALELLNWAEASKRPFAFEKFARSAQASSVELASLPRLLATPLRHIYLNDHNGQVLEAARENLRDWNDRVTYFNEDVANCFSKFSSDRLICMTNLPYGKRIAVSQKQVDIWLKIIAEHVSSFGVLASAEHLSEANLRFRNGGFPVACLYRL